MIRHNTYFFVRQKSTINTINSLHHFHGPVEQPIAGQSVARRSVKRTAEAEEDGNESGQTRLGDSRGVFAAKCFAV